jgi:proline iminopeptidase
VKANVEGIELHYEVDGVGPTCFVLPGGLGLDHTMYRKSLEPLSQLLRLVFLDFRCHGQSERAPLASITMEQLAADVVGLADSLPIEDFFVLGHSYGGFVAQEVGIRYPERVRALLLVATRAGAAGATEDLASNPLPPRPDGLVELDKIDQVDAELAARYWHDSVPHFTGPATVAELRDLLSTTQFEGPARMRGREILNGWSTIDRLNAVACPTLVVAGACDAVAPPAEGLRIVRGVVDAELLEVEGAYHWPWIEQPDSFYAGIHEWLSRHDLLPAP